MRPNPKRLELVLLARLSVRTKKPPTRSMLDKAIKPFIDHALGASEAAEMIEQVLSALERREEITTKPLAPTARGEQRLLEFLRIDRLPPRMTWRTMKDVHLTARVLGVQQKIKDADGLRGAVIRQKHRLPVRETPTINQAIDALVWRQLGVETDRPLSLNEVRAHVLRKLIGSESRLGIEKIRNVLAAEAAGSTSPDAGKLRLSLVRRWLTEASNGHQVDLDRFAEEVHAAAARAEEGRFGEDRVFIAAVWRALDSELSLEEFKRYLVEANKTGLVRLTRADLVPAMDPEQVSASETHYLNATFHFVEAGARGAS